MTVATCGAQRPSFLHSPADRIQSALGEEAIELARHAGLVLDDWQAWWVAESLAQAPSGQWAASEVALIVPRQNGKGTCLEALQLAGLFLVGDLLQVHSAHEFKTCYEHFLRIVSLIENTPTLDRRVQRIRRGAGEQAIELRSGERLRFVARSAGSLRGFSADRVYLDEAYALTATQMGAIIPTLSAMPNPQVIYASSAPRDESEVLRTLCRRGRSREGGRLFYAEWAAVATDDFGSEATIAKANPGYGIRISAESILMQRAAMDPVEFARERLGIPSQAEAGTSGIDLDAWDGLEGRFDTVGTVPVVLDVSPDNRWTSLCTAHADRGVMNVEVIDRREGSSWALGRLGEIRDLVTVVGIDATGPCVALLPELEAAGFTVRQFGAAEVMRAQMRFAKLVDDRRVRHLGNVSLRAAISGATRRPVGEMWRWVRKSSAVDITALVGVSMAVALAEQPAPQERRPLFAATR